MARDEKGGRHRMKKEAHKQKAKAERIKQLTQHVFNKKVLHWSYCSGCGLVLLNNEATEKRARMPCED